MNQIVVEGDEALKNKIVIEPELAIGTEFWIMYDNKPKMGLISGYRVWVTANDSNGKIGLFDQIFYRWLNRKQKEFFEYSYAYECKLDGSIYNFFPTKEKGRFHVLDKPMYFSKEELLKSL